MYSNFLLGKLRISDAALDCLGRTPLDLVARHAVNEHGLATPREVKFNNLSMKRAGPIKSVYWIDPTNPGQGRVVVETLGGWEETHVKLEGESCSQLSLDWQE